MPAHLTTALITAIAVMTPCFAEEPARVFILIGQSNMAGRAPLEAGDDQEIPGVMLLNDKNRWEPAKNPLNRYAAHRKVLSMQRINPGYGFAQSIRDQFPDQTVGLIVNARGGTSVEQWEKGKPLYDSTIERHRKAGSPDVAAVIWHQGEANSADPKYLDKLSALIANLRKDLKSPELPFVAGQVFKDVPVNKLIAKLPETVANTAYVKSAGLKVFDGVHFDRESQLVLGKRYADAVVELIGVAKADTR